MKLTKTKRGTKRTKRTKRPPPQSKKASIGELTAASRQLLDAVDKDQAELKRVDQEDRPAFLEWVRLHCGERLSRLEGLERSVAKEEAMIRNLKWELESSGSHREAYLRVLGRAPVQPAGLQPREAPRESLNEAKFKALYRSLVRRLHPDANPLGDAKTHPLWHQLQAAYHGRDMQRLKLLSVLTHQPGDPAAAKIHLAEVCAAVEGLRRSSTARQRKLAAAKKLSWWNFTRLSSADRSVLLPTVRQNMDVNIALLAERKILLQEYISAWGAGSRAPSF